MSFPSHVRDHTANLHKAITHRKKYFGSANFPFEPKYHNVEARLQTFDYKMLLDVSRPEGKPPEK